MQTQYRVFATGLLSLVFGGTVATSAAGIAPSPAPSRDSITINGLIGFHINNPQHPNPPRRMSYTVLKSDIFNIMDATETAPNLPRYAVVFSMNGAGVDGNDFNVLFDTPDDRVNFHKWLDALWSEPVPASAKIDGGSITLTGDIAFHLGGEGYHYMAYSLLVSKAKAGPITKVDPLPGETFYKVAIETDLPETDSFYVRFRDRTPRDTFYITLQKLLGGAR